MAVYINDDVAHQVNSIWLGPKGWTFLWSARYIAYGIGGGVFYALTGLESRTGISRTPWTFACTLFATVMLTRWIGLYVTYETRARDLVTIFWNELTAPRTPAPPRPVELNRARVKVRNHDRHGLRCSCRRPTAEILMGH